MEKQQELIRSVYGGSLSLSTVINFLYIFSAIFNFYNYHSFTLNLLGGFLFTTLLQIRVSCLIFFYLVLSSRAENVSNFVDAESIFGPVF